MEVSKQIIEKFNSLRENNIGLIVLIPALVFFNLLSKFISTEVSLGITMLTITNISCIYWSFWLKDPQFGLKNWLMVNLFGLTVWTVIIGVSVIFSYLIASMPEKATDILSLVMLLGSFIYLVGVGFYYIEKWSKP